ncbi:hypothetical protein KDK_58640 [Dictyobacter kobayashii]|uniref:Uncharacterized protein n=1 Tax=Dictyobacter kobayashii TaxID=2014872 RepID=A0A402ASI9_9CHLR|nr:hypothetical protein KDK_58640 [Dictyobacter kobayashii]
MCGSQIFAKVWLDSAQGWCTSVQAQSSYRADITGTRKKDPTVYRDDKCWGSSDSWKPDQRYAEWIDERPTCGDKLTNLANFDQVDWSGVYAESADTGRHTLLGFNYTKAIMVGQYITVIPWYYAPMGSTTYQITDGAIAAPDDPSSATTFTDRFLHPDVDGNATWCGFWF